MEAGPGLSAPSRADRTKRKATDAGAAFPYLSEDVTFSGKDGKMTYGGTVTAPLDGK